MGNDNKMKSTKNGKNNDKKFHSKHIKHDPSAESARAVFGLKDPSKPNE
ncbi:MAG: CPC_1213 family protein [Bacillota bacterium]